MDEDCEYALRVPRYCVAVLTRREGESLRPFPVFEENATRLMVLCGSGAFASAETTARMLFEKALQALLLFAHQ